MGETPMLRGSMTQPPIYPQYPMPPAYSTNPRPTSVTVLAVLGIIFGAIRTLCTPLGVLPFLVSTAPPNPVIDAYRSDPLMMAVLIGSAIGTMGGGILLLAGSIGALRLHRWARKVLIVYAWIAIVVEVTGDVMGVAYIIPKVGQAVASLPNSAQIMGQMYGAIFGGFIALTLPVLMLVFMNKPNVKAAFEGGGALPPMPPSPYSPPYSR